jgi:hypothetical protein
MIRTWVGSRRQIASLERRIFTSTNSG